MTNEHSEAVMANSVPLGATFIFRSAELFEPGTSGDVKPPYDGRVLAIDGFGLHNKNVIAHDGAGREYSLPFPIVEKALKLMEAGRLPEDEALIEEFNSEDALRARIGALGSPIRQRKGAKFRAAVTRILGKKPAPWTPEVRLRAYLTIGVLPEPSLLAADTLQKALSIQDCTAIVNLIARQCLLLDITAGCGALLALIRSHPPDPQAMIVTTLARKLREWRRPNVRLSPASVTAFIDVVLALLEEAKQARDRKKGKNDLLRLVFFVVSEAADCDDSGIQWKVLSLLESAQETFPSFFVWGAIVESDARDALSSVVHRLIQDTESMAASGDEDGFRNAVRRLQDLRFTTYPVFDLLTQLYADLESLPSVIQRAVADLRGESWTPSESDFRAVKVPDKYMELARALRSSWCAANGLWTAQEAFDDLQSVLRNTFGIQIMGKARQVSAFDPRVHEVASGSGCAPNRVRLNLPWVEMNNGGRTKVLIKAPVERVGGRGSASLGGTE